MKLKYMLRGLGIGIIITAAIMGAYMRNAVADARVAVMKEYGFGDEPTLVGDEEETQTLEESDEPETIPIILREETIETETESALDLVKADELNSETDTAVVTEPDEETSLKENDSGEDASDEANTETGEDEKILSEESETEIKVSAKSVQINVSGGDDSGTVSRKLYTAGVVDNASEFDAFLMQHGYDKKIKTGTKTIYATDTWQDIAEKLTTR